MQETYIKLGDIIQHLIEHDILKDEGFKCGLLNKIPLNEIPHNEASCCYRVTDYCPHCKYIRKDCVCIHNKWTEFLLETIQSYIPIRGMYNIYHTK